MSIPMASGLGNGSLAVSFLKSYQVFLWVILWLVADGVPFSPNYQVFLWVFLWLFLHVYGYSYC